MAFVTTTTTTSAWWRQSGARRTRAVSARRPRRARLQASASSGERDDDHELPRAAVVVRDQLERVLRASLQRLEHRSALLSGAWRNVGNNWILRPPASMPPVAVVHFVGGAFFAAAPHVCYDTLLQLLANRGLVVVATAYDLSFDHVRVAERVASDWERVESELASEFGALPVVGVAHSLGCVISTLAQCLFEGSCERAANVFISFCCRDADAAIPLPAELLRGAARALQRVEQDERAQRTRALCAARWATMLSSAATPASVRELLAPAAQQSARLLTQLRPLLAESLDARGDERLTFHPRAADVLAVLETHYDARSTLLLSFERDALDDGAAAERALRRARGGGGVAGVTRRVTRAGAHLTPLALSIIGAEPLDALALRDVRRLGAALAQWLHAQLAAPRAP